MIDSKGISLHLMLRTHVARNLLAIQLRLDIRIAWDDFQQKFQHAEYFTCDPLITQPTVSQLNSDFQNLYLNTHMLWCDHYFSWMKISIASILLQINHCKKMSCQTLQGRIQVWERRGGPGNC